MMTDREILNEIAGESLSIIKKKYLRARRRLIGAQERAEQLQNRLDAYKVRIKKLERSLNGAR